MDYADHQWFDDIFRANGPLIYRYAKSLNKAFPWLPLDPDDIVQEVFLCLYEKRDDVYNIDGILPWLLKTAKHKTFNENRQFIKRANHNIGYHDVENAAAERIDIEFSADTYIHLCEKEIGKANFEMLQEYYVDKVSIKELAEKQGIAVAAMRMRIHRWKQKCAKLISDVFAANMAVVLLTLINKNR